MREHETGEFELLDDVDGCCPEREHAATEQRPELWATRTLPLSERSHGVGIYRSADCAGCGRRLYYAGPRITEWSPADERGTPWSFNGGPVGFVDRAEAYRWARAQFGERARLRWWTERGRASVLGAA